MTKNIFKGAKFGDKFVTRDGRCAVLVDIINNGFGFYFIIENDDSQKRYYTVMDNGEYDNCYPEKDIVSRYQEPIDEAKLDELTWESLKVLNGNRDTISQEVASMMAGFKIGYRKALEGGINYD